MVEKKKIAIIGGGPGGYVAAIRAAQLGAEVSLIEKENLGGTCLNWGCIPTKAMVRSAEVYDELKNAKQYGCQAKDISFSLKKIISRKDRIVRRLVKGVDYLLRKNGVNVISGEAEIKDSNTVFVKSNEDAEIKTDYIIIATGSKVSELPIEGIELPGVIYSKQALALKELPDEMVIVGAGIIGMEFASIFATLGVKVTVVEYLDRILPQVNADLAEEMAKAAKSKKIKFHTGARVEKISEDNGRYSVHFMEDNKQSSVTGDKVLMAVGRVPNLGGIDIEELGIKLNSDGKGIKVNDKMETSVPGIYAIGDVTNRILLAHVASHQGIVAVKNIMGQSVNMDYSAVPSAIFTAPEIATVGLDEITASRQGINYETGRFPFSASGKVLTMGDITGFIKIIKEKDTGKVIGGSIIGAHATDLIAELTLAIKNGLTAEDIAETIHAHPTTAEVIHEAAMSVEGGAIHYA